MTLEELKNSLSELKKNILRGMDCLHFSEKKEELSRLQEEMQNPALWEKPDEARVFQQSVANLIRMTERWENLEKDVETLQELAEMLTEKSPECEEISQEYELLQEKYREYELDLLFSGEFDDSDAIIEINAGAGGTEAQDWAGMLLRMYLRFAEKKGFPAEIHEKTDGQEAGMKSALIEIRGLYAYGLLRGEKGTHRLVRQSPFNAKNLRQTSFAGIVVTPVLKNGDGEIQIEEKDIRVDTFRASGAGGQHVNKTDSAVRIVHIPTNIVVECQNQRSQHQNREKALQILKAKLILQKREEEEKKASEIRGEITEAAWGTQIRSYVLHPYKMVKDLRTNFESGNPDVVLDGEIDGFLRAYLEWDATRRS
ncbi:peptide chain release factor 2 [Candidatus Peregrinibacteria bacterium]|nr:MAG: peptide chain release factor 2 [Candidatus Peregrinibacteria bacterium]